MRAISVLGAAITGAVGMYFLDPVLGRGRRGVARDKLHHALRLTYRCLADATSNVRNRAGGYIAEHRPLLVTEHPSDDVLVARVRSEMGHTLRHAHRVTVTASAGWIQLRGPVLIGEREPLMEAVRKVPGVEGIDDYLDEHGWGGAA
jgi:hypothetical protein